MRETSRDRDFKLLMNRGSFPYAAYDLALDFKNQIYGEGGVQKALNAISGYAFTDSVDNIPNIAANGYSSLLAEASYLRFTANPITTDQDFIFWAVINFPAGPSTTQLIANMGSTTTNRISLYRFTDNLVHVNAVGTATSGDRVGQTSSGADRVVLLHRRRAGADTTASKVNSVVAVGVESSVVSFANPTNALQVGAYVDGTLQPTAPIEFVGIRKGTFTDADLTAILTAA